MRNLNKHQKWIKFIGKNDPEPIANIFYHLKKKFLRLKHDVVFLTALRKTRRVIYKAVDRHFQSMN